MSTPEGGSIWDEFLKEVDFTGMGDPDRLINRIYTGRSTPEQNRIYDTVRGILSLHEGYYHLQAEDFTSIDSLPDGVRRDWRGRIRFTVTTNSGLHVPIVIQPQGGKDKKFARVIQIDKNEILFNRQGKIEEVHLGAPAQLPKTIKLQRQVISNNLRFFIKNPGDMGIIIGFDANYKIGQDGLLSTPYKHGRLVGYREHPGFKDLFPNLFRAAIEATSPLRN